jgi:hypothetical protein
MATGAPAAEGTDDWEGEDGGDLWRLRLKRRSPGKSSATATFGLPGEMRPVMTGKGPLDDEELAIASN